MRAVVGVRERLLLLALAAVAGCDAGLDPVAPSGLHFSLSGYLDASADTQWVRVEPFARTSDPVPGPLEAEVTLELPGGGAVRMAQRVVPFETGPAHLFWTTADVVPGRTYAVVVRGADGLEARAEVPIPSLDGVTVELRDGPLLCPTTIVVEGAAAVVDAWAQYELRGTGRRGERYRFDKRPSVEREAGGALRASVYFGDDAADMDISGLPFEYPIQSEVVVAIGTAAWPDVTGLDVEDGLAEISLGQIEGGVGFVGGAVTQTLSFTPGFGRIPPFEGSGIDPEPCLSGPRVGAETRRR